MKCTHLGLPRPDFVQEEEFKVTLWRREASEEPDPNSSELDPNPKRLDPNFSELDPNSGKSDPNSSELDPNFEGLDIQVLLGIIKEEPSVSREKLAVRLGMSERRIRNILDALKERGILKREPERGPGRWTIKS